MKPKFHFSIHGDDIGDWRLFVYQYTKDKYSPGDTITSLWLKPKEFATLDELLKELKEVQASDL